VPDIATPKVGCNALYPSGRLVDEQRFGLDAMKDALRKLKHVGYQCVEYSHLAQLSASEVSEVADFARGLDLTSWSVHFWGPVDAETPDAAETTRLRLRDCVDSCCQVGGRAIVVHCAGFSEDLSEPSVFQRYRRDNLSILEPTCAHAAAKGIEIALENGRSQAQMQLIMTLVETLDTPYLGICVDTGHANLGDLGADRAIRIAGDRLLTTHLQDNRGRQDDHLPPGLGVIQWDQVFSALQAIGYSRPLVLELTDNPPMSRSYDQDEELRKGFEVVSRLGREFGLLPAH
jgi:sugar phosphate isomerase/epimerase